MSNDLEILFSENKVSVHEIRRAFSDAERISSLLSPKPEGYWGQQAEWDILHCAYAIQNEYLELLFPEADDITEVIVNSVEEYGDMHFYLIGVAFNLERIALKCSPTHPLNVKFNLCQTEEYVKENFTVENITQGKTRPKDCLGKNIEILTDSIKRYAFYHSFDPNHLDVFKILQAVYGIISCIKVDYMISWTAIQTMKAIISNPLLQNEIKQDQSKKLIDSLSLVQDKWDYSQSGLEPYEFIIRENQRKLATRFPENKFSEEHSKARLDKV